MCSKEVSIVLSYTQDKRGVASLTRPLSLPCPLVFLHMRSEPTQQQRDPERRTTPRRPGRGEQGSDIKGHSATEGVLHTNTRAEWVLHTSTGAEWVLHTSTRAEWVLHTSTGAEWVLHTSTGAEWVLHTSTRAEWVLHTSTGAEWVLHTSTGTVRMHVCRYTTGGLASSQVSPVLRSTNVECIYTVNT